jgi:hypothetical protein
MIAVASCGVALGAHTEMRRIRALEAWYGFRAGFHADRGRIHGDPSRYDGTCLGCFSPPFRPNPRLDPALAAYHAAMRSKYERAARCPWLPVEPDPPVPKLEPEPK